MNANKNIRKDGFSGFFYRDDFKWDESIGNSPQINDGDCKRLEVDYAAKGKYEPTKGINNFTSKDQIYGLLYGMVMTKKMLTPATTPEEQKVLDNANKSIVALLSQALGIIDLLGCFKDQGGVIGSGNQGMRKNQLIYIAQSLGLFNEVQARNPSATIKWSTVPDNKLFEKIATTGCLPGNQFQVNHYLRLHSICPMPMTSVPSLQSISAGELTTGTLELVNYTKKADKPAFALAAAIMNKGNIPLAASGFLQAECNSMKELLEKAPCCGPCYACPANPSSAFKKECTNPDVVFTYKCYRVPKDPSKTTWFTASINEDGGQCGKRTSTWAGNNPIYYNGIDFMQNFNYWLLACNDGNEDNKPKLNRPADPAEIKGCENEGKLHIAGPSEVCPGEKVEFKVPMETVHLPVKNASWGEGGNTTKTMDDFNKQTTIKDFNTFMQSTNITMSNQPGAQSISYTFEMAGTQRTITKQVTVLGPPTPPVVVGTSTNTNRCLYSVQLANQGNSVSYSSPNGDVIGDKVSFEMLEEPYEVTIYAYNRCGQSVPTTYIVPKREKICTQIPRVVQTNAGGINPLDISILCNPQTKTINIKSEVLYLTPFDCRLYDMAGRLVDSRHFETIDISIDYSNKELQSGLYIFSLSSGETFIKSSKFYIENY